MLGFEPFIPGLTALILETVKEAAKKESGGVLAKLLTKDIGKPIERIWFEATGKYIQNYEKRHGELKVACVRMDEPMKLEQLYTAVRVLDRSELRYFESAETLQVWFRQSGKREFGFYPEKKQDGIAVANWERYLMVLGGPGVGKSTFLRKVGLEALKRKQGTFQHDCIPVFLALQQFKSKDITVEQLIAREFETCGYPEPQAVTQAMLKQGRLLILLDGLDEVPLEQVDHTIDQIRNLVDRYANNRFIASCRIAAYKGGFPCFKDVAMAPFDDGQIQQFITNWFRSEKDREANTAAQCWKLLQRPDYAAAKNLAETPLLLTLLCAVYDKSLDFPKNRATLYGEALDVLLKEWAAEKRIQRNPIYQELSIELERELLAEIAYESFVVDQLFIDKREVARRIKIFLVSNLNAPKHLDGEKVLEAIEMQQGILVERARDVYSFSHLTLQEYLTAQYIVDNHKTEWLMTNYLTDDRWRGVFLLVAGLMPGKTGANDLLIQMEQQAKSLIDPWVQHIIPLVKWSENATQSSEGDYEPASKRAISIYLALAYALDLNLDLARALAHACSLAYALNPSLALTLNLDHILTLALDLALTLNLAQAHRHTLELAYRLGNGKIFKPTNVNNLIHLIIALEAIGAEIPDNGQIVEVRLAFADRIRQLWFEGLLLHPLIMTFSEKETDALSSYLYVNDLMIRCKEAAVRVSPSIWKKIEERMLTVRKEDKG